MLAHAASGTLQFCLHATDKDISWPGRSPAEDTTFSVTRLVPLASRSLLSMGHQCICDVVFGKPLPSKCLEGQSLHYTLHNTMRIEGTDACTA